MDENTGKRSLREVHELLERRLPAAPRVYEAGGGSASILPPKLLASAHVTVVDIDDTQVKLNQYADKKLLGDIQTYPFPSGSFDLIVCYNVIEHLDDPEKAIRLFCNALAPGGLIFIGAPIRESFSGWVTRVTPHWFHVQYYRWVLKYKGAGRPGTVPFPTVFHPIVSPRKLIDLSRQLGCDVVYFREYKGMIYENMAQRRPWLAKLLNAIVSIANLVAFWQRDLRNGDYHLVVVKAS